MPIIFTVHSISAPQKQIRKPEIETSTKRFLVDEKKDKRTVWRIPRTLQFLKMLASMLNCGLTNLCSWE
jgi:hypothetical protein